MTDPVADIAAFIRRSKLPVEETVAEAVRRWPEATSNQLERAARAAIAQLQEDTEALLGMAALWDASAEALIRKRDALIRKRGGG